MRAKVNQGRQYQAFVGSGQAETVITQTPNAQSLKQCAEKGLSTTPIQLRLIRVDLGHEVEVLITNLLDQQTYPASDFKALYHLRWGVEENYKRLKQWAEIENFSGKSALSVQQDFYAKVVSTNLTAIMVNAAQKQLDQKTGHRRHTYQINFAQALSKMKNNLIQLI